MKIKSYILLLLLLSTVSLLASVSLQSFIQHFWLRPDSDDVVIRFRLQPQDANLSERQWQVWIDEAPARNWHHFGSTQVPAGRLSWRREKISVPWFNYEDYARMVASANDSSD